MSQAVVEVNEREGRTSEGSPGEAEAPVLPGEHVLHQRQHPRHRKIQYKCKAVGPKVQAAWQAWEKK